MDKADMQKFQPVRSRERQPTRSTVPHQNAKSDVHNQVMVAIRGKAYNAMSVNAAERANRCAEVRLKNAKKHIDFMQHLDLVRLNRDKLEMIDRLEKFKKSMIKIRADRASICRRESLTSKLQGDSMMNSKGGVSLPIFSEHSPRFRKELRARNIGKSGTKLKPLQVASAPNALVSHHESLFTPHGIQFKPVGGPTNAQRVDVCNFPRMLDVVPHPRLLDGASMAQAFQVITLKGSRQIRDQSATRM